MDQLVVAALQEGGVDGHHGLEPLAGQAGGKGDGVLLGDADVVVALGKALLKLHQARTLAHGRRDAHQARVVRGHVAQPLAKDLGEALFGRLGGRHQAHGRVELAGAVVGHRVGLGQLVALALPGDHVQELRAGLGGHQAADVLQRGDQRVQVVPVDGADVVEAELLEQGGRHHHALGLLLQPLGQLEQRRHRAQHGLADVLGRGVEVAAHQLRQIAVERAHRRADGHVVVVEHHQQARVALDAGVVERLEGHARRHGAVADDGHGLAVLALLPRRQRHAQRRRDAGGRVRGAEGVVRALVAARKARHAAQLAQRGHARAPAGEDLVRIGLVAHVPHQPVVRGVEDGVQRDRQLDGAQVGAEVPAGARHVGEHALAQLVGQPLELGARQAPQRGRVVDGVEQGKVAGHGQCVRCTTWSASARRAATSGRPQALSASWACARRRSASARAGARPSRDT